MNVLSEQTVKKVTCEAVKNSLLWALQQNYHLDRSNAAIHTSQVRYSPLTFRLAEVLSDLAEELDWDTEALGAYWSMLNDVLGAKGQYEEDTGR